MNEPPIDRPAKGPPPVTDSPWFWLALFGMMGLGALLAIGPKYGQRQASIERKHQAQQQMLRLADGMPVAGKSGSPEGVEYSQADSTIVSLWPIRLVVLLVTVVSVAVLAGQRIAQRRAYSSPTRDDR